MFEPIAIVGRGCVLPGALSPAELWDAVAAGRDLTSDVPAERWRMPLADALCAADGDSADRTWTTRGGYVAGFERVWDPHGYAIAAAEFDGLDPLAAWTLHAAREALREVRTVDGLRIGAVFGNLGFPSEGMAEFAAGVWHGDGRGDPRNRAMSGGTAALLARALRLDAGCHALDAACASSLYAFKLACDRLHDGDADLILAGAVQRADDLFLHIGFSALGALSRSGRSRPFHRDADGLLPAEGAAFLALKRLADARRDGDTIHGVIRGIGLSNDGRGKGLLAPAEEGQLRAIHAAYAMAGIDPARVSLLECHATGTPVGDATELRSSAAAFCTHDALPIGSLKSNVGHLITVAGAAGVIKVLEAMRMQQRPPTLHADVPTAALAGTPFRLLTALEPWPSDGPRIAAVSAFGFGGNNAHLVLSEHADGIECIAAKRAGDARIAIVGIGCTIAAAADRAAFTDALFAQRSLLDAQGEGRIPALALDLEGLRFPPRDLARSLPQQLALLHAAREALFEVGAAPRDTTGIVIGMEPDNEVARYGMRWRLASDCNDPAWLRDARDAVVPVLEAAAVVGTMPNIPANRIGSQFDLAGPAYTVQAGAASGLVALRIAARGLRCGELDAAIVGAVDMGCEPVQRAAIDATPGDAAVVLVLKRLDDPQRDGDRVYALLDDGAAGDALRFGDADGAHSLQPWLGHAHAAHGLVHVAAAALALHHRRDLRGEPWLAAAARRARVELRDGAVAALSEAVGHRRRGESAPPRLHCYAGADRDGVLAALRSGSEGLDGPARLVLVADEDSFDAVRARAIAHLAHGAPAGSGVHYRARPIGGEIAFAFAGAGAGYHGMGRELLQQLPQLQDMLAARSARLPGQLAWSFGDPARQPTALEQLWGASALSQLHVELTRGVLGLQPQAWLGYSSGESNALVASGIWRDADALMDDSEASGLIAHELGGEFAAVRRVWQRPVQWATWNVLAPVADVEAAIADLRDVHVAIVNSEADCLIAGDADGCAQAVGRIGAARCVPLVYPIAVHVPELDAVGDAWLRLHMRDVVAPVGQRIYSNAWGRAYAPTTESCAQAILQQANRRLDLRPAVLAAWNDGVRVFVEHGPGGAYGRAIRTILGERDALVVSLDRKGQGVDALLGAVAALLAAGVPIAYERLQELLQPAARRVGSGRVMNVATHLPEIALPAREAAMQMMQPAPRLPSALVPCVASADAIAVLVAATTRASDAAAGLACGSPHGRDPEVAVLPEPPASRVAATAAAACVGAPARDRGHPMRHQPQTAAAVLAHLAQAHQAFVRDQQAVHTRFLALRRQATATLLHAARSAGPAAASAPPVAAAVPPQQRFECDIGSRIPDSPMPAPPVQRIAATVAEPADIALRAQASSTGPRGLTLSRAELEVHADGRISTLFGPAFAGQDGHARQVRMPRPPLLLADRVTGIDAVPASMGTGTVWTETDVTPDAWYLHHGHMPAGVMIEAGQADLLLISYLGVDALNRGERVYRLLGCELTYHGDLPKAGDTLQFDIHLDGHAAQDDVRLMFFHYDCVNGGRRQLSVRRGQAGFFTDAELAASAGCLWSPEQHVPAADARLDPPLVATAQTSFTRTQLEAFAAGDTYACFGTGYEFARTHTRSPSVHSGRMLLLDRITDYAPDGGPWRRGYLRAEYDIAPDQWFFDGHFKNDPCMPGTLMFDGCLQAMAFYLAAYGCTLPRDGWRFQPVPELPYKLQCRGQVTPRSRQLVTEVFVEEIVTGPVPTLYADLLCTVDGLKAFHARRVALQLVPAWPLDAQPAPGSECDARSRPGALLLEGDDRPVAVVDGFRFDHRSLIACALGRPSEAFGPMYRRFDGPLRAARLPSPPYHFMSRIAAVDGPIGVMRPGAKVTVEYDVPDDVWYFDRNGARTMPFSVLLEAALQPCGWLASYVGSALTVDEQLGFRNLDGHGTVLAEITGDSGTLTTDVELLDVSATAGMIIETFAVTCRLGTREVYRLRTVFGFFPPEALAAQAGLPVPAMQRELLQREAATAYDLDAAVFAGGARIADGMLRMIDRIDGWWPQGGAAGLGQIRASKRIDSSAWFFRAHFFQDPVQPGSLGLEAMVQTLQAAMRLAGMDAGIANPRFEALALDVEHRWKYRGQVLPHHALVQTTLEITDTGDDARGRYAIATASLWADGQRIYEMSGLGVRIVAG